MNCENYVELLQTQRGYCNCVELSELYKLKREPGCVEFKCGLPSCRDSAEDFEEPYSRKMNDLLAQGSLVAIAHRFDEDSVELFRVPSQKLREVLTDTSSIISIHCLSCKQLVDLVDSGHFIL